MNRFTKIVAPFLQFLILGTPLLAAAQQATPEEEDELAAIYGNKSTVSIATGTQQNTTNAPASATVITARDIQALGATDITQVLESVPGLHVSTHYEGYFPKYIFRGISSEFGAEVLVLINGYRLNTNFVGIPSLIIGQTPVANISRIEIIRGPGSALYGADAFSGVINIITKGADEIHGLEAGSRIGSFKSRDAWIQYGGKLGKLDAALFLQIGRTNGQDSIVGSDFQSVLDGIFATRLSRAPGPVSTQSHHLDARIDLRYGHWQMRLGFQERKTGAGAGLAAALDPIGKFPEKRFNLDVSYQKKQLLPSLDLTISANLLQLEEAVGDPAFTLLPPGTLGGLFPNGVIGNPGHSERDSALAVSLMYSGFPAHRIRAGLGHEIEDLYKVEEFKNFTFINGNLSPLGQTVNATGNPALVYLLPHKRSLNYAFVQDEWNFATDWNLTAGLRHDRYSDFGSTTNPRLALVWNAAWNLTFKALHGRAFRSPSFTEQYSINNPTNEGNPNLRPERIRSNELAALWRVNPAMRTSLTLFQYKQSDIIRYLRPAGSSQARAANAGDRRGHGLELESTWDISRQLRLSGNYSWQRSTDEASGKDAGLAPQHHLFLRADWHLASLWSMVGTINYVAGRKRQPDDPRIHTVPDYTTVDVNLRREKLWGQWELQASVKNLFNRDAREPSVEPGNIAYDLPLAGRAVYLQLGYQF